MNIKQIRSLTDAELVQVHGLYERSYNKGERVAPTLRKLDAELGRRFN